MLRKKKEFLFKHHDIFQRILESCLSLNSRLINYSWLVKLISFILKTCLQFTLLENCEVTMSMRQHCGSSSQSNLELTCILGDTITRFNCRVTYGIRVHFRRPLRTSFQSTWTKLCVHKASFSSSFMFGWTGSQRCVKMCLPCTAERGRPAEISKGRGGNSWRTCSDEGPHTSLLWAKPTPPAVVSEELGNPSPPSASTKSWKAFSYTVAQQTVQQFELQYLVSMMALPLEVAG